MTVSVSVQFADKQKAVCKKKKYDIYILTPHAGCSPTGLYSTYGEYDR